MDAAEQLADLERDGVYGAVLIGRITDMPNAIPADADIAYCKVANDWLADHWGPYLIWSRPESTCRSRTSPPR